MHIVNKCHDSIQIAMDSIDPEKDTSIVIEKYKSGDVPPGDFNFEDMQDPHSMLKSDALKNTGPTNLNLYPRKRELEKQMQAIQTDLIKSKKELDSLNQMISNPHFNNDSKKVKKEIQHLHDHVTALEAHLTSMKAEHVEVEEKLEALRNNSRSNTYGTNSPMHSMGRLNRGGSTNSSGGSVKSSSLSIGEYFWLLKKFDVESVLPTLISSLWYNSKHDDVQKMSFLQWNYPSWQHWNKVSGFHQSNKAMKKSMECYNDPDDKPL